MTLANEEDMGSVTPLSEFDRESHKSRNVPPVNIQVKKAGTAGFELTTFQPSDCWAGDVRACYNLGPK